MTHRPIRATTALVATLSLLLPQAAMVPEAQAQETIRLCQDLATTPPCPEGEPEGGLAFVLNADGSLTEVPPEAGDAPVAEATEEAPVEVPEAAESTAPEPAGDEAAAAAAQAEADAAAAAQAEADAAVQAEAEAAAQAQAEADAAAQEQADAETAALAQAEADAAAQEQAEADAAAAAEAEADAQAAADAQAQADLEAQQAADAAAQAAADAEAAAQADADVDAQAAADEAAAAEAAAAQAQAQAEADAAQAEADRALAEQAAADQAAADQVAADEAAADQAAADQAAADQASADLAAAEEAARQEAAAAEAAIASEGGEAEAAPEVDEAGAQAEQDAAREAIRAEREARRAAREARRQAAAEEGGSDAEAEAAAQAEADREAETAAAEEAPLEEAPVLTEEDLVDPTVEEDAAPVAAAVEQEQGAPVEEEVETVAAGQVRESDEDFSTDVQGDAAASRDEDDEGLSNLEKALLVGLGTIAVGALLDNGQEVVTNSGDRVVTRNPNGDYVVYRDDDALLRQEGATVRTQTFDDGSTRTIVERVDGTQIVTIRDPEGRVLRRARVLADGTQVVLLDDTEQAAPVDVRRLREDAPRPVIVSVDDADEETLRRIIERPVAYDPGRTFTLRQIREIAVVRDLVPGIDLDAITFASGSAAIPSAQLGDLVDVGLLIEEALENDPSEVFLIEGHTDAVGSEAYNLALSDRRAETVALALTENFAIAPENLVVQGYGEAFLKVPTESDEQENRRATVRRITPLLQARGSVG